MGPVPVRTILPGWTCVIALPCKLLSTSLTLVCFQDTKDDVGKRFSIKWQLERQELLILTGLKVSEVKCNQDFANQSRPANW